MSLVNRMLKDLSTREPTSANVMQGIRLETTSSSGGSRQSAFILLLALLAAGAGWWWWSGPGAAPAAIVATAPASAEAAPEQAPVPAAEQAQAVPAQAPLTRFGLDESLSSVPPPGTASKPARPSAPKPAPKVTLRESTTTAAPESPATAAAPAASAAPPPAPAASAATPPAPEPATAAATAPATAPAPSTSARAASDRFDEAMRAIERGDLDTAEQRLAEARALNPRLDQERFEDDPVWVGYRRLAARLALARNRPAEAISQLESAELPSARDDPEYNGLLASAYQRMNRHADASRLYRALATSQPEQGHWWAGYAISREALGDLAEARRAYAQALRDQRLDPGVSRYVRGRLEALNKTAG